MRSARAAVDSPITTSAAAPLIGDGFRRAAQHVHRRRNNGKARYNRHSRARMAETAKDASRHATPDAPERIDHRRRCTRLDHRTCCRGSRGSASPTSATTELRWAAVSPEISIRWPAGWQRMGYRSLQRPSRCLQRRRPPPPTPGLLQTESRIKAQSACVSARSCPSD